MIKKILSFFIISLISTALFSQTTGTFVVADNGVTMSSCDDTLITLADILNQMAIHDLNDPSDNISKYKLKHLEGSVITTEITGSIKYSDYPAVFVEKDGTHNGGIAIFLNVTTPPTKLFDKDTLKYTVERGAKINYTQDFFNHVNIWSSNKDVKPLQERILITDMSVGTPLPISQVSEWSNVGKGTYRITYSVSVCRLSDILIDTIFVVVDESPCHNINIKNLPSVCLDQMLDLTPYVYLDGHVATSGELADMTFWDRSKIFDQASGQTFDPHSIDISTMWDKTEHYPNIEIVYQPNVAVGTCQKFTRLLSTKVPSKFVITNLVIGQDLSGRGISYTIDGNYYSFNNTFHKDVFKKLYLDNFQNFVGTTFNYFTDNLFQNPVAGNDLTPGDYFLLATNPSCNNDSTSFAIHIENRDFDIIWNGAENLGKGYYIFTAPIYPDATYTWFVWGGSIVAGLGTDKITVYYSENAAPSTAVTCQIDLPVVRTASGGNILNSAVYLTSDSDGKKIEISEDIPTGVLINQDINTLASVYPNPADGVVMISGKENYEIKIYDMLGELVYEDKDYISNTPISINSKGIHMIHLNRNNKRQTLKVYLK